ncbi:MAG: GNAT family N-acetyltransferase [Chitinophagaceae bacterium]
MSILLQPMTGDQFQLFKQTAIPLFAQNKVLNGDWPADTAAQKAAEVFQQLLSQEQDTPGHFFYSIIYQQAMAGYCWYAIDNSSPATLYLYEIWIRDDKRDLGLGTAVMQELQILGREQGVSQFRLHVFGINQRALSFYQRLGFQITDYQLSLTL